MPAPRTTISLIAFVSAFFCSSLLALADEQSAAPEPAPSTELRGPMSTEPAPGTEDRPLASAAPRPGQTNEWHRVAVKLSGSMCIACLKELEQSLLLMPGVNGVKTYPLK